MNSKQCLGSRCVGDGIYPRVTSYGTQGTACRGANQGGGGITLPESVLFSTVRGTIIRVRAAGTAWVSLCDLRTSRQSRTPLGHEQVISFVVTDKALTQGRRFRSECFARTERQDDDEPCPREE